MIHLNMTKCNFWKCGGILNELQRFSIPHMYDAITEVGHATKFSEVATTLVLSSGFSLINSDLLEDTTA